MKVWVTGSNVPVEIPISHPTGFVADRIEITSKDVAELRRMLAWNPVDMNALLMQLEYRFADKRAESSR